MKKGLEICILVCVLIVSALSVFALTQTPHSPEANYGSVTVKVEISKDNQVWGSNDVFVKPLESWFVRCVVETASYEGNVSISWQLQKIVGVDWENEAMRRTTYGRVEAVGDVLYCYYPMDVQKEPSFNYDWGKNIQASFGERYRIEVSFEPIGAIP